MGHMNAPFPFIQPLMAVNMPHVLYESQSECVIVSVEASISYHSVCFKRSFQNAEVSCDLGVELDVELKAGVWSDGGCGQGGVRGMARGVCGSMVELEVWPGECVGLGWS